MNTNHYFWTWFYDNQKHLINLQNLSKKLQKHYIFWLQWHLEYYSKGVSYILIFPKRANEKTQLILTANGKPEYFEKVELLVSDAPKFKNWVIAAFVKPTVDIEAMMDGRDEPYVFRDITLKASEVKFMPLEYENEKKIDMIIYLKCQTIQADYKALMQIVYLMVEDILGEKFLHENINFVEIQQHNESENDNLIYLYDLQFYLDEINKADRI